MIDLTNTIRYRFALEGKKAILSLLGETLNLPNEIKELEVKLCSNLPPSAHVDHRLNNANRLMYSVIKNRAYNVKIPIRLGQNK